MKRSPVKRRSVKRRSAKRRSVKRRSVKRSTKRSPTKRKRTNKHHVVFKFFDPVTNKNINVTKNLIGILKEHRDALIKLQQKARKQLNETEYKKITKEIHELQNKYYISKNLMNPGDRNIKGNIAVEEVADMLSITPSKLIKLIPEISYFEDVNAQEIKFLLHLYCTQNMILLLRSYGINPY